MTNDEDRMMSEDDDIDGRRERIAIETMDMPDVEGQAEYERRISEEP